MHSPQPDGPAGTCERCGREADEHHVGVVCIERGPVAASLPWALRSVQLSGGATDGDCAARRLGLAAIALE
jgi:hypothetical protein